MIDRGFVRLAGGGLVHYRTAGPAIDAGPVSSSVLPSMPALYMAHSGPGSSLGLVPLIAALGRTRRVVAPDMPGNGDSDPPAPAQPDIAHYAACAVETLDRLGLAQVDFYGQHTGAQVGCELALRWPGRVRRLVLDGVALFPAELKAQMLAHYAPAVEPDEHGGHLAWAWNFVRELSLHFPHFLRDPAHRLHHGAVPEAALRQALVVDLIKALPTYHLAYQAAFAHPVSERLPLLRLPTLLMAADGDPLGSFLDAAAALVPGAQCLRVTRSGRAAALQDFLDSPQATEFPC